MDDDHHDALVGHRKNGMDDLKMDANLVVNRDRRMNDLLDDLNLVASRVNRNCVRHDLSLDAMTDVNLCHRMNDQLDDQNLDVTMDVSLGLHMNDLLGGHLMDGNRVNRNCVRRDLMMVVTMDVKNLHVKYY